MNDYLTKDMGYHTPDKKKYMDAEEAYNLTTDTIEYTKEKLLETIMSKIDKAARKGEYLVHIYENISSVIIDELRNLGYEVINNYSQRDGDDFIIKWIKPYADKQ